MYLSLRDEALGRQDQARLARRHVPVVLCPVHEARTVTYSQDEVAQASGFILTSQQAAYALPKEGTDRVVYSVGRASAYAARCAGYHNVKWGPSDGRALAEMISADLGNADRPDAGRSLCWLRAKKISFDIAAALQGHVTQQVVYEMCAAESLSDAARAALRGRLSGIMILSQAQLACFVQLLQQYDLWQAVVKVPIFAVSQQVAEAALSAGFTTVQSARRKRAISVQAAVMCHHLASKETL